jgi:hypothetical protein
MYVSRRHSRHLLLPPGWVALGFLLLLGCQALLTHGRQLRWPNVMQLTMPMIELDTTSLAYCRRYNIDFSYKSLIKDNARRHWLDVTLADEHLADFIANENLLAATKFVQADTSYSSGVRVRFRESATYANLVGALDIMNQLNQKKYWLDIYSKPITLYAVTDKPLRLDSTRQLAFISCGTRYYQYPVPTEVLTVGQVLQLFWEQNWRPSVLLLFIISALNFYCLARLRLAAR